MKFVDMFCGMGTIRMGFEQAGHECVYSVEWDKHKRKIYEVIFGHEPEGCDITRVRADDIPPADCWCFGAPCQDFSVAGLRAGLDGERSGLVREVFRLVGEKEPDDRPEWLLYENVKGMLSSNLGWDFAAIQAEMGELGYDVQWQLLNSKDFGVPQNRERVYTLGHLRARGGREIFPLGSCNTTALELSRQGVYTNTITAKTGGAMSNGTYVVENQREAKIKQIGNIMPTATRDNPNQGRVYDPVGLAPCLNKGEGGGLTPMIVEPCPCLTPYRPEKRQNGRRFKEPNEPMFTLTKQDVHGVLMTQKRITRVTDNAGTLTAKNPSTSCGNYTPNTRIRRLTPRECMRLQGVPDYITDKLIAAGISDTQMYRAAGDACSVPVVYAIAERIRE
jgi:DNA (cytosine-5)-methyltransferase 1